MAPATDAILELLNHFIHLRRTGTNRDEAWYATLQKADHLSESQIKRLLMLAKNWEQREGNNFRGPQTKHTTVLNPQDLPKELRKALEQNTTGSVIRPIQPPTRQAPSAADLGSTSQLTPAQDNPRLSPAYLIDAATLLLYFRGVQQPLRYTVKDGQELLVGRVTPNSAMAPDVDLGPLNAGQMGVSRLHAALQRRGTSLLLTDLGSLNHTLINGQRLHPQEVRALSDGDIIKLGQLEIGIRYHHAAR
ncbi:MAG: FHA domain-containing protein [Anaerolineae bacterium]|nr:FHA domain-containing protein [Anaerolineae bacterium]